MNTGSVLAQFTITLSKAVSEPVAVEWFTSDGTAKAGVDYAANKGTALFVPGETAKTVDILVYGRAVGAEDRSFFVEMLPPTNAILGASIGECIIHVDTSGSQPVTRVVVPTGPKGDTGNSAYQDWIELPGNAGKTEEDFFNSLKPSPAEVAQEVSPLIDVGNTTLTAEGTESVETPDSTTVKALARRVAYAAPAKIGTVVMADGKNTISSSDLTGDTLDFFSPGVKALVRKNGILVEPSWSVRDDGKIDVLDGVAGETLYLIDYGFNSRGAFARLKKDAAGLAIDNASLIFEPGQFTKVKSFENGVTLSGRGQALLWNGAPQGRGPYFEWQGTYPKIVTANSTPDSSGGVSSGAWKDVGDAGVVSHIIARSRQVNVPAEFTSIYAAMNYLRKFTIAADAVVTIKVADGTYQLNGELNLNHADGVRIRVIGNESDPSKVVLSCDKPTANGFTVSDGHRIAFVNGFTLKSVNRATLAENFMAVCAIYGSYMNCGSAMKTDNWYYGFVSQFGSTVVCRGVTVDHAGDVGIWAFCGSFIYCDGATSNNAADTTNQWGFGFQAEYGSTLCGSNIKASGCLIAGAASLSNSTLRVHDCQCNENIGSGLLSRDGGGIECHNGVANKNQRYGWEIITGYGTIVGVGFTGTDNTLGFINAVAYTGNLDGQAQVSSTIGPIRYDSKAAHYFNTPRGLQFSINDGPAGTNTHPSVAGGVGIGYLYPETDLANADLSIAPKGDGLLVMGKYLANGIPEPTGYIVIKGYDGRVIEIPAKVR